MKIQPFSLKPNVRLSLILIFCPLVAASIMPGYELWTSTFQGPARRWAFRATHSQRDFVRYYVEEQESIIESLERRHDESGDRALFFEAATIRDGVYRYIEKNEIPDAWIPWAYRAIYGSRERAYRNWQMLDSHPQYSKREIWDRYFTEFQADLDGMTARLKAAPDRDLEVQRYQMTTELHREMEKEAIPDEWLPSNYVSKHGSRGRREYQETMGRQVWLWEFHKLQAELEKYEQQYHEGGPINGGWWLASARTAMFIIHRNIETRGVPEEWIPDEYVPCHGAAARAWFASNSQDWRPVSKRLSDSSANGERE